MSDKNPKHPLKKKKVHEKMCVANHSEEDAAEVKEACIQLADG